MDFRPTPTDDLQDPPVLYLRNAIIVRDPARAAVPMTPEAREWLPTLLLSGLAAIAGSVLGWYLQ